MDSQKSIQPKSEKKPIPDFSNDMWGIMRIHSMMPSFDKDGNLRIIKAY